jgi:hypothetical protein
MQHATSIRDGRDLAGNEEREFSVKSPDIDVPPTLCQGSFSTIRHMDQIRTRNDTSNHPRRQNNPRELRVNPVTAFAPNPVKSHTHVQQVAAGQLVNRLR